MKQKSRFGQVFGRSAWNGSFLVLILMWFGLIVVTDWFFFRAPFGWTLGLYALLLTGAIWVRGFRSLVNLPGTVLTAIIAVLSFLQIEHPGILHTVLTLFGLVSLALLSREGWKNNALIWIKRWKIFSRKVFSQLIYDSRIIHKSRSRYGKRTRLIKHWFIPVVLSLGFVFLFSVANPIISGWMENVKVTVFNFIFDFSEYVPGLRIFLWAVSAFLIWGLLRLRTERQGVVFVKRSWRRGRPVKAFDFEISPAFIVRCLALFNAVFAVQTVMDVYYLWGGAELPEGMGYAEYAHRGAYPLIAAALLAALFVIVTFRDDSSREGMVWARRLVYAWIGQNIFLAVSSIWRLVLYMEVYSLTRLRIAAGIWMLLVAAGLIWICVRIVKGYTNNWLINVNVITLFAVLFVCCFINVDGLIAGYNVKHCREAGGKGPPADLGYLVHLGPESLPALIWLDKNHDRDFQSRNKPSACISLLRDELKHALCSWQGWSMRRKRLSRITGD